MARRSQSAPSPIETRRQSVEARKGRTIMAKHVPAVLLSAFVACGVVACGGEGPEGPAGAQGLTGASGQPGEVGQAGEAGVRGDPGEAGLPGPTKSPRLLDCKQGGWRDEVRAAINKMIREKGIASPAYDPAQPPVAVFDWDNTVVKNDIGDATFFWMIKNDKIRQPSSWSATNGALKPEAVTALAADCAGPAVGAPLPTSTNVNCAEQIAKIYNDGKYVKREPAPATDVAAWNNSVTTTINQQYAWVAQLQAGYTPNEIRSFAREAFEENTNNAELTTQSFGSVTVPYWLRVYSQMDDLIGALKDNGFDVWVLTASPQFFVDAISSHVGIDPDHVVGIRNVLTNGKVTYALQDCGGAASGSLITFDEGKRCWINKVVYGEADPVKQLAPNVVSKRPLFVAGDSDTDIAMLKDATDLKLVVHRAKTQTVCNAYESLGKKDGRWFIQPMFIRPNAVKGPFACTTATIAGTTNKIVNESGAFFATDFTDTVYTLGPASTCK
jgi:phosphoserine phosphatase